MQTEERDRHRALMLGLLIEGGLGVLALASGWLVGIRVWLQFSWNPLDAAWGAAASLPILAGFALTMHSPSPPLVRIRQFLEEVLRPLLRDCSLGEIAILSALAGLGEEMLFRGVLQTFAAGLLSPIVGVVIASALFGLAHAITPTYAVVAGVIGAYLGWLWVATENLLVPVIAHALYDFVALAYLLRWERPDREDDDAPRTALGPNDN